MYSKRATYIKVIIYIVVIVVFLVLGISSMFGGKSLNGAYEEYKCDVKNFRLATTVEIKKDDKYFGEVKGNLFTLVTDPLTLYDSRDNKIAYAGDAYHFIAQDSHTIYINDEFSAEMVGQVELFGEYYKIYNENQELIAKVDFNSFNTTGEMYDADGNLIAVYSSNYFFNDFTVKIAEECELDHNTVLMIMCSYYSDQHYDN